MNQILQDQNKPENIRLLKAQAAAYTKAKKIQFTFEYFALLVALLIPIFYIFLPEYKTQAGIIGSLLSLLALAIDRYQKGITKKAASIQEMFDRTLFRLPGNNFMAIEKVSLEEIVALANRFKGESKENWYSKYITRDIPHNIAVILCQKSNLFWDVTLRKKYKNLVWVIVGLYFFLFLIVLFREFAYTQDFLFSLLLLLAGGSAFIKYSFTVITEKGDMIKEKLTLNLSLEKIVDDYKNNKAEPTLEQLSHAQTIIYNSRKRSVKIPDWFNAYHKKQLEKEMDENTQIIIADKIK